MRGRTLGGPTRTAAGVLAALLASAPILAAPATAASALNGQSVAVAVAAVTPTTPWAGPTERPLTFTLTLANHSDQTLNDLEVTAERGTPIDNQHDLDQAISKPAPPSDPDLIGAVPARNPVTASLSPASSATVTYRTSSSRVDDPRQGMCVCAKGAIYPIFFTVHYTNPAGNDVVVGTAQTYLPAFDEATPAVQVSWLWPLIDRPHLLTEPTASTPAVFTDDDLATSISTGRLSRVLQVAEAVTAAKVPLTLVADPELIYELSLMSTGSYRYQSGATTQAGSGGDAAAAWLRQLKAVLDVPGVELDFTPPSDPEIASLSRAGLSWRATLDAAHQTVVTTADGGHTGDTDVLWPNGETLDPAALATVAQQGATTVILNDSTLPPVSATPTTDALAPLQTSSGQLVAAVTSSNIERWVAPALSVGGTGAAALPPLVSEVAMRAIEAPTRARYVLITPPRDIDPDPAVAATVIEATAKTAWSTPLPLDAATATVPLLQRGNLAAPAGPRGLPDPIIQTVRTITTSVPALQSMLLPADAATALGAVPDALQRAESTAWTTDRKPGIAYAAAIARPLTALEAGVHIQRPSSGAYTLASHNSPLPLTIDNTLPYPVRVQIDVDSVNGVPGFTAAKGRVREIPAASKLTLQISTHVERTGRFQVQATLLTPSGRPIGDIVLSIHSTALGVIGVVITIVAGAVLVLALLIRFYRRLRHRRRGGHQPPKPVVAS